MNSSGKRLSNLIIRLLVSAIFIPIIFLFIVGGELWFFIPLLLVALIASMEAFSIANRAFNLPHHWKIKIRYTVVVISVYLLLVKIYTDFIPGSLISLFFMVYLIIEIVGSSPQDFLKRICSVIIPVIYVVWGFSYLILLRQLFGFSVFHPYSLGAYLVAMVFTVAWMSDSFGMLIGSFLGKHPLIPSISPHKTVEGSIGCILGAVTGAIAIKFIQIIFSPELTLPWIFILLAGIVCGFTSQFGDLIESAMKRDANLGESSEIVPGHGGILDKFDSVVFTAISIYYLFYFLVG
ncbi:MAG: phosphatidate cytidylyltransferase [bacterium]